MLPDEVSQLFAVSNPESKPSGPGIVNLTLLFEDEDFDDDGDSEADSSSNDSQTEGGEEEPESLDDSDDAAIWRSTVVAFVENQRP